MYKAYKYKATLCNAREGGSVQRIKSKSALAASDPFRCGCFDALRPPALSSSFMDPHHHHLPFPQVFLLPPPPPFFLYLFLFDVEWKTLVTSEQGFCQGSIANRVTPSSPSSQILPSLLLLSESRLRLMMWAPSRVAPFLFRTFSFARSLPPSPPSRKKIRERKKKLYSFLGYCWCLPRNGITLQGSTAVRQQVKIK